MRKSLVRRISAPALCAVSVVALLCGHVLWSFMGARRPDGREAETEPPHEDAEMLITIGTQHHHVLLHWCDGHDRWNAKL